MYRPEDYPELEGKEPEWVASEREMFAEQRDKNKDGHLDFDEMKAWIMPEDFDHADIEAKHLVHVADDNKVTCLGSSNFMVGCFCRTISSVKFSYSVPKKFHAERGWRGGGGLCGDSVPPAPRVPRSGVNR